FSCVEYGMNNWFAIRQVVITGNMVHINPNDLKDVAQNRAKGNLFTININYLQNYFKAVPWVQNAVVSREFPNSLSVEITEYQAVAKFANKGLIAPDGNVFLGSSNNESLPIFYTAAQNVSEALDDNQLINETFKDKGVKVVSLTLNGYGLTKVELSNQLHLIICGNPFNREINLLHAYWDKLYKINPQLNYVNMCYKNAMAINQISRLNASSPAINKKMKRSANK
ncbi:MAG: FtsQ-type POTRA domain-containing protein, partial [Burkholderiales bacterium]|nr:FtsQ-type POTRA domain-containing protein [Burkholderiales bacterium]